MMYLSGRISSNDPEEQQANLQKFHDLEKELVARGFEVFNPAKFVTEGKTWEFYLARDLKYLYEARPMLYLMEGWEQSRGARLEVEFAKLCGLQIISSL
jgi:hypothetical protein